MKKIYGMLGLAAVVSLLAAGCGDRVTPGAKEVKRGTVSGLTVEAIRPTTVDEYVESSGTIRAKTVSMVSSRTMGTVTALNVKEGDRVRQGQQLLMIDDSDVIQKVKAATEGYKEAEKAVEAAGENRRMTELTWKRYRRMHEEKALSAQEFDQIETQKRVADLDYERAKAALRRAEAGLNEARVYHGYSRVTSPVQGVVSEKKIDLGSMAAPGMPLVTVEDDSSFRLDFQANESLAGRIRTGMEARVRVDSLNKELPGRVTEVVPSVDPASRSFLVKVSLPSDGLRNGVYAKVSLAVGKKEALLVPAAAVVGKGQLTGVYVVDDASVIVYRLVRTGRAYGDRVELLSGVKPGDRVVTAGAERAADGALLAQGQPAGR